MSISVSFGLYEFESDLRRNINSSNLVHYVMLYVNNNYSILAVNAKGATDVQREDWSYIIAPFWKAVIKSSLNLRNMFGVLKSGFSTLRGAYAMLLMLRGFNMGVIKFGLVTCTKPEKE